jgi:AAA ATPase domain
VTEGVAEAGQGRPQETSAPAPAGGSSATPASCDGGRDHELGTLRRLVPDLLGGRGGVVVITGPTGIGKTFLARSFVAELPEGLLAVTAGPNWHLETPALWPMRQIARALLLHGSPEVEQTWQRLDRVPPPGTTGELAHVHRMIDFLVMASAKTPVVALLDDLQRTDVLTLATVEILAERLHAHPLLLVVCSRTGGARQPTVERTLGRLRGHPHVVTLSIGGLPDAVVENLVAATREGIEPAHRKEIARLSAGNPLLAQELTYLWAAQQRIADLGGPAPALPASATLRDLVAERLAAVDADNVLAPLALLGRTATLTLLSEAGDVPAPVARRAVERAAAAGLITVNGSLGQIRMAHSVFGDVLLQRLDPVRAREIHLRLAALFDRSSRLPGPHQVERARHLIAAGDDAQATAAACLVAAVREEHAGGLSAALELVSYGLDNCTSDLTTRVLLLRTRGRCLFRSGEISAARRELLQAVETARLSGQPPLFAAAVADLTAVDGPDTGADNRADDDSRLHMLREALAAGDDVPDPIRAVLSARLAELLHLSDPARSRQLAQAAVASAGDDLRAQLEARQAWALTVSGLAHQHEIERSAELIVSQGLAQRPDAPSLFLAPALVRGDRTMVDHVLARAGAAAPLLTSRTRGLVSVARLGIAVADADASAVRALTDQIMTSSASDVRMLAVLLQHMWTFHTDGGQTPQEVAPRERPSRADLAAAPSAELADLLAVTRAALSAHRGSRHAANWLQSRLGGQSAGLSASAAGPAQDVAWAVTALAGRSRGHAASCRAALTHLGGHLDRFVTLSTALIGPVG